MVKLISKVQFKISEKGEFHHISIRSLADTLALIHSYPWDTERSLASVELSCPSVTIEHPTGTYLKIGPYFSGKFSVYYLERNSVYLKIANNLEEACELVAEYFQNQGKLKGLDKYGFTINALAHFHTNPFEYTVNTRAIATFFWFPILMVFITIVLCFMAWLDHPEGFTLWLPITMIALFSVINGPFIYLYLNYSAADNNLYMQISRGHDDFTFGMLDKKRIYRKQDISAIERYGRLNSRGLWGECYIFIIHFKNGEQIKFSCLLIMDHSLRMKLPGIPITHVEVFFPTFENIARIS